MGSGASKGKSSKQKLGVALSAASPATRPAQRLVVQAGNVELATPPPKPQVQPVDVFAQEAIGKQQAYDAASPIAIRSKQEFAAPGSLSITEEKLAKMGQEIIARWTSQNAEKGTFNMAMYVPLQGTNTYRSESTFDLDEKIGKLITERRKKGIVLFGDAGGGKTTYVRLLYAKLDARYSETKQGAIPLYIDLPSLEDYQERAIEETLEKYGFTEVEIANLKKDRQFVFIMDGYDELQDYPNLWDKNELLSWNTQVIISCRTQHFNQFKEGYEQYLCPVEDGRIDRNAVEKLYVAQFSQKQRAIYIQKYLQLTMDQRWTLEQYEEHIERIGELSTLAGSPFILKLLVEALPDIMDPSKGKITYFHGDQDIPLVGINLIYDVFVDRWFAREIDKYENHKGVKLPPQETAAKNELFKNFCQRLASLMHRENRNEIMYKRSKGASKGIWDEFFGSGDEEIKWCLHACPLIMEEGNDGTKWKFLHKTLQEYFVNEVVAKLMEKEKGNRKGDYETEQFTRFVDNINVRLETGDSIKFRANSADKDEKYKLMLFRIIEESKKEERLSIAAANAITALNYLGISFIDMDLSGIRIPGANLSGAMLDSVNFKGADLRNVKFINACLRGADFTDSNMDGVEFGEYPYIETAGAVKVLEYSPKGNEFVSWCEDSNEIQIWNVTTGELARSIRVNEGIRDIKYNHKGDVLAVACGDKVIRLYNPDTGEIIKSLEKFEDDIVSIAFSPDGESLAIATDSEIKYKQLFFYDFKKMSSNSSLLTFDSIKHIIYNSNMLLVVLSDFEVNFTFNIAFAVPKKSIFLNEARSLICNPNEETIAIIAKDGVVSIYNIETTKVIRKLEGNYDATCMAYSPDGKMVAVGTKDKTVIIWETETGKISNVLEGHQDEITTIKYSADGKVLISGSKDQTIRIWNIEALKSVLFKTFEEDRAVVNFIDNYHMANLVISGDFKGSLSKWDKDTFKALITLRGIYSNIDSVRLSPDKKTVLVGIKKDNKINILETSKGKLIFSTDGYRGIYLPDGKTIAIVDIDNAINLLDLETKRIILSLKGHPDQIEALACSSDGKILATSGRDNTIRIWELKTAREIFIINTDIWMHILIFSPDGRTMATLGRSKNAVIWDLATRTKLIELKGHHDFVQSIAYSPDSKHIVTGGRDNTVRIWAIEQGKMLSVLNWNLGVINEVIYSHDGKYIFVGSEDKTLKKIKVEIIQDKITCKIFFSTGNRLMLEDIKIASFKELSGRNCKLLRQRKDDTKEDSFVRVYKKAGKLFISSILSLLETNLKKLEPSIKEIMVHASNKGFEEFITELIRLKVNLDTTDESGNTALIFAAQNGHMEVVKELLKAGAKVDLQDKDGYTALLFAAENGHIEVIKGKRSRIPVRQEKSN